jgi:superfamily II DNA/RNA helicase
VLRTILRTEEFKNAIIFCNKKTTVRELYTSLKRSGFAVGQIQGDMDQSNRIAEFDRFKKDEITVLVASDVAARGLDVKGVSHVINFDVPWQPDDYIHRIGRTGRAGMKGIAITLATREDNEAVAGIEKLTGIKLPRTDAEAVPAAVPVEEAAPQEERPAKARGSRSRGRSKERTERPERTAKAPAAPAEPELAEEAVEEYAPTVEPKKDTDAPGAWNGPVPSFLQFSAA